MSTFKTAYDKRVEFKRIGSSMHLDIKTKDGMNIFNVILDPADAPAIALAVLEAAGHEEVLNPNGALESAVESLAVHIRVTEATAATAAEEAARNKRRDELARALAEFPSATYATLGPMLQRAIDRIIDTENELAKERAK